MILHNGANGPESKSTLRRVCQVAAPGAIVNDVMISHNGANGPESKSTLRRVCQVAAPGAKFLSTITGLLSDVQ